MMVKYCLITDVYDLRSKAVAVKWKISQKFGEETKSNSRKLTSNFCLMRKLDETRSFFFF